MRAGFTRPVMTVPVILILLALGALAALGWLLRRGVCIRRKDCCGKSCGCLFPARRD